MINNAYTQTCSYSTPTIIQAEDSIKITLDVAGLINDDLSSGALICGVRLFFSHGQLGNVRMTLVSPAGQEVVLVGPATNTSGLTSSIDWSVQFTQCGSPASPDVGFTEQWDNNQAWASFTLYDGVYYPSSGCLEDFNTGSANGLWTLVIDNLGGIEGDFEFFEIIFCDPTGSSCDPCFVSAGDLQEEFFTTCQQDIRLNNLDQFLSADFILNNTNDQSFAYILSLDDDIIAIEDEILESDTLAPGNYTICGIAFNNLDESTITGLNEVSEIEDLIENRQICADITDPCFSLFISEVDNLINLDTTLCIGDTISFFGIEVFDNLDTNILRTNQITCDSLITIRSRLITTEAIINAMDTLTTCGDPIFLDGSNSITNGNMIDFTWMSSNSTFVNDIGPVATVNTAGTYLLEVNSNGCTDTASIEIVSIDTFDIDFMIDGGICIGDQFNVQFSLEVDNVAVDGPSLIDFDENGFSTEEAGIYIVESTIGQCLRRDTLTIDTQATNIEIEVSSTIIDCDSTISRTNVMTNAIDPRFDFEGEEIILDTTAMINIFTPGIYSVTVTDINGCTMSSGFIVEGSAEVPTIMTEDLSIPCNQGVTPFLLEVNSLIDSVLWNGPNGFFSREMNPIPQDTGQYTVTVFAPNGCIVERNINFSISNIEPIFSVIGDTLDCRQDSVMLCVQESGLNVQWLFDNDIVSSDVCVNASTPGIYALRIIDMNGCTGSGNYDLVDNRIFDGVIENLPDSLILSCIDTSVLLEPNLISTIVNSEFSWTIGDSIVSSDNDLVINEEGIWVLEVTNPSTSCSISDTVVVSELSSTIDPNNITIIAENINCEEDSAAVIISGIDLEAVELSINQQLIDNPFDIMLVEGEYEFLFVDTLGCDFTLFDSVIKDGGFTLDLGPDIEAIAGNQVTINVNLNIPLADVDSLIWSDPLALDCTNCLNPLFTVSQDQFLSLQVIDINGCVQSDELTIIVLDSAINNNIYIPNVFAPNVGGDNSFWTVYLPDGNSRLLELRIYDRWGNLVTFRSDSLPNSDFTWDGTYRGVEAEQGVYVFVVKYLDNTNRESLASGQITLIR